MVLAGFYRTGHGTASITLADSITYTWLAQAFLGLLPWNVDPEAAAMMRTLFVSMQDLNKGARRPTGAPASQLKRIGIIGAGFMGASIAYVTANAGIEVVLIDRDQATADKGKGHSEKLITDQVNRGRASAAARDALLTRIVPTYDYAKLSGCDLVIEAVFEDRKIKAETIAKAQAVIGALTPADMAAREIRASQPRRAAA